ncbi:hypothetical protein [Microbacterium sp. KR10-403]|uniref:hypothetical protein n=1 Tax=Microbacterium sp. KR10-403 TaxID=3158581 RepID=UPI0032E4BA7B
MRYVSEYVDWQAYQAGATDSHGNEIDDWADPVTVGVYAFDPGSTSEPREPGHDRVIVEPTVYMPTGTVFGPHDRVTARGLLYEVDGYTREWHHPSGNRPGNVATLRRVDG